ncbi:hypothetical protein BB561_004319 [Smittium simulii]|uniref:Probable quinone oxidoreductase n=1 Tax=Smittium simulii TaxID=133385 RepID=A0A2T9YGW8_9FUNG|nr:hypothetical protein BB561_004319 [Smittium simulii]
MKAIQVSQPGDVSVLEFIDTAKPQIKPGMLLVKNKYSGVNYIDTYFRSGLYPTPMPTFLGREASGVIEEVGEGISEFSVGDRVAFLTPNNSYAEYSLVSPASMIKLLDSIDFETGAACLLQGLTALTMVKRSYQVKKGDIILVHAAAGGTGRLLVQLCKHYGATVIATVSTEEKAKIALSLGADHVIFYNTENVAERVGALTGGQMVNAVFDGVGKNTFMASFDSLRRCGTLVSFGNASGKVPPIEINMLSKGNIVLLRPMLSHYIATREEFTEATTALLDLISHNALNINVCKVFDLKDAALAHEFLEGRNTTGKVLLKIE